MGIKYEYNEYCETNKKYIHLNKYTGNRNVTEIVIPDEIDGIKVKALGRELFANMKNLKKVTIPKSSYNDTGKAIKPTVTVKINGTKLKKGIHYTVTYKNNKKAGTAIIKITGKGKYYGVRTKQFKIKK